MRFALLFLLSACSSLPPPSAGPYYGGEILGTSTYHVETRVEPHAGEPYRFGAIFQPRKDSAFVSALGSNGHTVFHARDSLHADEPPEIKFPSPEWRVKQDEITLLYLGLRAVLLLRDKPSVPDPTVLARFSDGRPRALLVPPNLRAEIEEYDWHGHVRRMSFRAPAFTAEYVFSEYQREPEED